MFSDNDRLKLPVTFVMADGRELVGDMIVNIGGAMERTLNNDAKFILFGDPDGSERLIAKSTILEACARKATKAVNLPGITELTSSDPYTLLGISNTATDEEIRKAYLARANAYHPDHFASAGLPAEIMQYVESMSRRVNEAYATLMQGKTPALTQQSA